ncbi:MAG: hypothetical protein A2Y88_01625 [Chloroflexi bacterium RBG_13_48_10]|nr:MAG: hypothetical protein A2Y88_01625 [Chloroflexi bacterium RBG_13_48_10]
MESKSRKFSGDFSREQVFGQAAEPGLFESPLWGTRTYKIIAHYQDGLTKQRGDNLNASIPR